jgi:hypothetical protein
MDQTPTTPDEALLTAITRVIKDFINAEDLDEARRIVSENKPLLLDPVNEVEAIFAVMLQRAAGQEEVVQSLRIPRTLLRRSREIGVRAAFEELRKAIADEVPLPAQDSDILSMIARNTIAVMTIVPKKRKQWFATVRQIRARASEVNDEPMLALMDAVSKLLLDDALDSLSPQLEGAHAACWVRIIQGINEDAFSS